MAERDGQVVGWASTDAYRARACYAGVAEFSIYVDAAVRGDKAREGPAGRAGGHAAARRRHVETALPHFVENAASRTLCQRCGFREVGIYEKHAKLDGVWRDTIIVRRKSPRILTEDRHARDQQ